MRFKEFLVEFKKTFSNEVDIIYQQLLDNLENTHVEFDPNHVIFNVGIAIKRSNYKKLNIIISKLNDKDEHHLDSDEENEQHNIIIHSDKMPKTNKTVIIFLEREENASKIKNKLKQYLELTFDIDTKHDPETNHEKRKNFNKKIEIHYRKLTKAINDKLDHITTAKDFLNHNNNHSVNHSKREVTNAAIKQLLVSELGDSFNKFKSMVMKLPEAEFINHLESNQKSIILSRLESYFEHKIQSLHSEDKE